MLALIILNNALRAEYLKQNVGSIIKMTSANVVSTDRNTHVPILNLIFFFKNVSTCFSASYFFLSCIFLNLLCLYLFFWFLYVFISFMIFSGSNYKTKNHSSELLLILGFKAELTSYQRKYFWYFVMNVCRAT